MDLSFAVHKLAQFLSKPGKVHFGVLVHLFRYIRNNNTLGLNYYADINDSPVYYLLRQWFSLIVVGKVFQTLAEVQENKLTFIMVAQLTMAHMFQDQMLNQVHKVSTMQHALQEWL